VIAGEQFEAVQSIELINTSIKLPAMRTLEQMVVNDFFKVII